MKAYKYDIHVHTAETSSCGRVGGAEVARLYREAGYDGIVVTDHYCRSFFNKLGDANWEEKVDMYLAGYRAALQEGRRIGLSVIPGIELTFDESCNDYLVFGIDEQFLKENSELYRLSLEQFSEIARKSGMLVVQAHPFRVGMTVKNPLLLDGVEVFNGNPRHNSRNDQAYLLAEEYGLHMVSGSDFHQPQDLARGGIIIPEAIETPAELVKIIKENKINELISCV